jgi:NADH:ubiquinone oxidoreductase subunit 4 (subunit M)
MRFAMPCYPHAAHYLAPVFIALAVIGIIYGALVAMVQKDVKKLVAYSSVSHLGFVMLGLFTFGVIGATGGLLQMVNHGLSTGALFLLVGVIYERRHTRLIADFGGLARVMPAFAAVFMIVTLSSIGLPGTNGFIGEFLILLGAFGMKTWWPFAVLAATGVILAAAYMLWMYQRVFFGGIRHEENGNWSISTVANGWFCCRCCCSSSGSASIRTRFWARCDPACSNGRPPGGSRGVAIRGGGADRPGLEETTIGPPGPALTMQTEAARP